MKTKILSLLTLVVMALGLTACHEDITPGTTSSEQGSINLRSMGVEINNAEKVITSSRAGVDLSGYLIEIYSSDNTLVANWKYSEMPELFSLAVGTGYTVKVRSHEVQKAEWENPYFYGEKTFDVKSDEITEIGVVTCSLANVKVTVDFDDDLRALMSDDCVVTVNANDEGELKFTASETRAGYFAFVEGSTTLTAVFAGTVQGNQVAMTFTATDLAAGQWRKITFSLTGSNIVKPEETGTIENGGIGIDASITSVDLTGKISVDEDDLGSSDRPGQQKPETGDDNQDNTGNDNQGGTSEAGNISFVCSDGLSLTSNNKVSDFPDGSYINVDINASKGIKNLVVTITTTNEEFAGMVKQMYLDEFDLAHPTDNQLFYLKNLGLPNGDAVLNHTTVAFNISQFIPLLSSFNGEFNFSFSVTDNDGNNQSAKLTFVN